MSCGGDNGPSRISIKDFIAGISDSGGTVTALLHSGAPPAAGAGPILTVTGGSTVINGGSAQVNLTPASGSFTDVYVVVEGVDGYYQLTFPGLVSTAELLLTLAQHLPRQSFNLTYAIGSTGAVGATATVPVSVITVGSGEVQVSVSWNAESDVDLHVVDPSDEEIYYANTASASGGMLDLDSNPACSIDHKKNENITWAHAPAGSYTVRVDYFAGCGVPQTSYVVTVQRKGHGPETFTGSFSGDGDAGGGGSGTTITTFTYP